MKSREDLGKLILRLVLGILLLFHGVHKVAYGIGFITKILGGLGLPPVLGYAVFLGEVVGPILLILGIYARIGGLLVVVDMIVAVLLFHTKQFFTLAQSGGWQMELQAFYFFSGWLVVLLGAGRFSLKPQSTWN